MSSREKLTWVFACLAGFIGLVGGAFAGGSLHYLLIEGQPSNFAATGPFGGVPFLGIAVGGIVGLLLGVKGGTYAARIVPNKNGRILAGCGLCILGAMLANPLLYLLAASTGYVFGAANPFPHAGDLLSQDRIADHGRRTITANDHHAEDLSSQDRIAVAIQQLYYGYPGAQYGWFSLLKYHGDNGLGLTLAVALAGALLAPFLAGGWTRKDREPDVLPSQEPTETKQT